MFFPFGLVHYPNKDSSVFFLIVLDSDMGSNQINVPVGFERCSIFDISLEHV